MPAIAAQSMDISAVRYSFRWRFTQYTIRREKNSILWFVCSKLKKILIFIKVKLFLHKHTYYEKTIVGSWRYNGFSFIRESECGIQTIILSIVDVDWSIDNVLLKNDPSVKQWKKMSLKDVKKIRSSYFVLPAVVDFQQRLFVFIFIHTYLSVHGNSVFFQES